jgi:CubicO group peptidase (beta-lactamase class C family)
MTPPQRLHRALLGLLAVTAAPLPSHAAPDEAGYGSLQGYPVGSRSTWFRQEHTVGAFSAMEQLFPVHTVAAGRDARSLPSSASAVDWPFVQPYLDSHPATGLLVMKHGRVLLGELQTFKVREAAPGQRFKYISADTQVLAQVLARATGRPLAEYVSEKIWTPMGAEADAAWTVDGTGVEAAYCCLSARLRDWARLGQLLLDRGQRDGKAIIPAQWVDAATTVRPADGYLRPQSATPYFGYGYQTWIFPDQLGFALLGVCGQAVFVHPKLKLVMVQTAVWPRPRDPALSRQRDRFWRDVVKAAAAM